MNREVIIACDFDSEDKLWSFLENFKNENEKPFLKIGMELFYLCGPQLIEKLKSENYKIFLDLKLHDIPTTVYKAMKSVAKLKIDITNVHAAGGKLMMESALKAIKEVSPSTKLIAVTQLTSTDKETMNKQLQIPGEVIDSVKGFVDVVKSANLDGIVCSAKEANIATNANLISVTPGIRYNSSADDQKRVCTPAQAKELTATHIVVGRSITQAQDVVATYKKIVEEFK